MQYTSNYRLKKQELTDKADITQISENWDTIDSELATVDGKSGGAITGDVEINGHLSTEGFNTKLDYIKGQTPAEPKNATWNILDSENNRVAKVQFNISESGVPSIGMYVNKNNNAGSEDSTGVVCQWNDVTPKVSITHNPDKAANDNQIATTNWVKSQIATSANEDKIKKIVLDLFFPIGAVYLSADNNFNPNSSWGGNWVKIEDRFLLGSGSRGVGVTGGEETHTLTESEMPSHTHSGYTSSAGNHSHSRGTIGNDLTGTFDGPELMRTDLGEIYASGVFESASSRHTATPVGVYENRNGAIRFRGSSGFTGSVSYAGDHSHSMSLNNTGGNIAHNNMPPFEVVNIWRRVA